MTSRYVLDWPEARRLKSENRRARWDSIVGEFTGEVWPELSPSFQIHPGDTVFTIGSCFARNIEVHLMALGCRVPMLSLDFPTEEVHGQPRSAMNRFHPPAFRQCLEWTAAIFDRDGKVTWADCEPLAIRCSKPPQETFFDLDMAGALPASRERFVERRQHIYDIFSTAFSAQCMMMTPGYIEAFKDRQTGLYIYGAPANKAMLAQPERWEYETLSFERCLEDMLAAIDVLRARNPDIRILVTTSPVPLGVTFSGRDVRIANTYSKSVLRAVCDVAAASRPMVDYFPSFETVMLSSPQVAWGQDRLHVSQALIGKIVSRMTDHYLAGVEPYARHHQLALSAINDGDSATAAAAARAAIELEPDRLEARLALSEALIGLGDWSGAEREALILARKKVPPAGALFKLARALGPQGRLEEAMAWLGQAMELPGVAQSDVNSVSKLIAKAPPELALPVARRVVERFPMQVEMYAPLAMLLIRSGMKAEALELIQRALQLSKPPLVFRVWLAELLAWKGEFQQAQRELDRVLSADPGNVFALKMRRKLGREAPAAVS